MNLTVTTKTTKEITAAFTAVFNEMRPTQPKTAVTQAERLAPFRKEILKQRTSGFSWKQIAKGMADPRIGEHVSEKLLRTLFGGDAEGARKPEKKPLVALKPHVMIDPLTGQTITLPPPA